MKDPAALVFIDKWIASTIGMRAEFRAWYFDLILYQFDNGSIPDSVDTMAGICKVLPSEYNLFNQMVNQVVNQKFTKNESGNLVNKVASEIITNRKLFKEKRTKSSNIAVVVKYARKFNGITEEHIGVLKKHLYNLSLEEIENFKNQSKLKDLVNHLVNLYINVDVNINNNINEIKDCLKNCLKFFPEDLHPKTPSQISDWEEVIEKVNRIDGFPFEEIERLVEAARSDSFWSDKFLSILKLRRLDPQKVKYIKVFEKRFGNKPKNKIIKIARNR